jgi:probable HAF family extracellular repeat protein
MSVAERYVLALVLCAACDRLPEAPLAPGAPPALDVVNPAGYDVIDLGTLGGANTTPAALSDSGQVVGSSQAADGSTRAFLWEAGTMSEVVLVPPDAAWSSAQALNNAGRLGGLRSAEDFTGRLFLWDRVTPPGSPALLGQSSELDAGDFNGWEYQRLLAITDGGDVLGQVEAYGQTPRAHALVWRGGVRTDLGGFNAFQAGTYASAWNAREQIVGKSYLYGKGPGPRVYVFHPFLWDDGQLRDLGVLAQVRCVDDGTLECGIGWANDINDQAVAVGSSTDSTGLFRAFIWQDGAMRELGAYPGQTTAALAVNNAGQVLGTYAATYYSGPDGGFVWQDGAAMDLGSLGGGGTVPVTISEAREVIGSSLTADGSQHVFLWRDGQMTDLGAGPIRGRAAVPVAINARGDVLGMSATCTRTYSGSCYLTSPFHAVLWRKQRPVAMMAARRP